MRKHLTDRQLEVLVVAKDLHHEMGAIPNMKTVGEKVGISPQRVAQHFTTFCESGYLVKVSNGHYAFPREAA